MREIEEGRRHAEREPRLEAHLEALNDNDYRFYRLRLTNHSAESLGRVQAEILDTPGVRFTAGIYGTNPSDPSPVLTAFHPDREQLPLAPGDRATWQIEIDDDEQGRRPVVIHLRIVAACGSASWPMLKDVGVPDGPPQVW